MDIKKGLNTAGKGVEHIHINFLRYILGCGKNITAEVLRAEASSPAYHIQIVKDVFRLWNSLKNHGVRPSHPIIFMVYIYYYYQQYPLSVYHSG